MVNNVASLCLSASTSILNRLPFYFCQNLFFFPSFDLVLFYTLYQPICLSFYIHFPLHPYILFVVSPPLVLVLSHIQYLSIYLSVYVSPHSSSFSLSALPPLILFLLPPPLSLSLSLSLIHSLSYEKKIENKIFFFSNDARRRFPNICYVGEITFLSKSNLFLSRFENPFLSYFPARNLLCRISKYLMVVFFLSNQVKY